MTRPFTIIARPLRDKGGPTQTFTVHARTAAQALASRYRDPETGACLTCVAVCECTGGRVLRCSWCKNLDGGAS